MLLPCSDKSTKSLTDQPYQGNHLDHRSEVTLFVDQNREQDFVTLWQNTIINENLDSVIASQYLSGIYASQLFIRACGIKLNILYFAQRLSVILLIYLGQKINH